jgi:hypothetical protein
VSDFRLGIYDCRELGKYFYFDMLDALFANAHHIGSVTIRSTQHTRTCRLAKTMLMLEKVLRSGMSQDNRWRMK